VIKVALNPPAGPTLPSPILRAVVATAHRRGLRVTGHVYGLGELDKALAAGVDELAHMLMSRQRIPSNTLARMVAQDVAVVPTLAIFFGGARRTAVFNLRAWLDAGGRVIYGTDLGNAGPRPGIDRRELRALQAAGMNPRDIIASATVESARWLGMQHSGVIQPGAYADVVAVRGNPRADLRALTAVAQVWRRGRRVV
jgi:imidazolonepropionase-like amidohydrolase